MTSKSFQLSQGGFIASFFEVTRVVQFKRMNPPTFTGSKKEKYLQGFTNKMEKIFRVMHASDFESVEFAVYKLKDMAYQWYKE